MVISEYKDQDVDRVLEAVSLAEKEISDIDSLDMNKKLRFGMFKFFSDQFSLVKKRSVALDKAQEKIEAMIERDELNFDQLIQVVKLFSGDINQAVKDFLEIFKPMPGVPSPFASSYMPRENDPTEQFLKNLPQKDLEKLDTLYRAILVKKKDV
jgi:hypothetical protein